MRNSFALLLLLCVVLIFSQSANAQQTTTGFTNPDSIRAIIEYRLPSWGYSNFFLNSSSGNFAYRITSADQTNRLSGANYQFSSTDTRRNTYDLALRGTYIKYRETDRTLFDLVATPNVYISRTGAQSEVLDQVGNNVVEQDREQLNRTRFGSFDLNLASYLYSGNDLFAAFRFEGSNGFSYGFQKFHLDGSLVTERNSLQRTLLLFPELAVGIGRVRNVTPLIRAIRLNERLGVYDRESTSNAEIVQMAQQISKRPRYNRSYDRPDKYFWDDMNAILGNRLSDMGAFDAFFLEDVFNESLGSRYEGYEILLGAQYTYTNQLNRIEDGDGNIQVRQLNILRTVRPRVSFFWSRNFTLEHQLSVSAVTETIFPLEKDITVDWYFRNQLNVEWLWNIADHSTLITSLGERFAQEFLKDRGGPGDSIDKNNLFSLGSTYTRYLENKFQIGFYVGISHLYDHARRINVDGEYDDWNFSFGANATYYFFRNIY